jgi:hypothetical protein
LAKNSPDAESHSRDHELAGIAVAGFGLLLGIASLWPPGTALDIRSLGLTLSAIAMVSVGAVIIARTGRRIGWVAAISGGLLLASNLGGPLEDLGFGPWLYSIGLLMFLFPDGRPVSRGWNWILWASSIALASSFLWELLGPDAWSEDIGIGGLLILIVFGFVPAAAVSLVVRYVRSSGVERLQLRWLAFVGVVLILLDLVWEQLASIIPLPDAFWDVVLALALLALPTAIGMSILRYKLYEIDRIISRTLSYSLVVAVLGLVYAAMVTLATSVLPTPNSLVVAAATLAIAAMFNPLRRRVQRTVDRRFNRSGYRAQEISDEFGVTLQESRSPDQLVDYWTTTVANVLQPIAIGVWVNREAPAHTHDTSGGY